MRSLHEAIAALRPKQREAIFAVVLNADGAEHIDDLAFAEQILLNLIDLHEDTRVGWCLTTARSAMLDVAADEGLIPPDHPWLGLGARPERRAELAHTRDVAAALNQALVDERHSHDLETRQLRDEIADLNLELAKTRVKHLHLLVGRFVSRPNPVMRLLRWLRGHR